MRESIASVIAVVAAMVVVNNVTSVRAGPLPLNAMTTKAAEPVEACILSAKDFGCGFWSAVSLVPSQAAAIFHGPPCLSPF